MDINLYSVPKNPIAQNFLKAIDYLKEQGFEVRTEDPLKVLSEPEKDACYRNLLGVYKQYFTIIAQAQDRKLIITKYSQIYGPLFFWASPDHTIAFSGTTKNEEKDLIDIICPLNIISRFLGAFDAKKIKDSHLENLVQSAMLMQSAMSTNAN